MASCPELNVDDRGNVVWRAARGTNVLCVVRAGRRAGSPHGCVLAIGGRGELQLRAAAAPGQGGRCRRPGHCSADVVVGTSVLCQQASAAKTAQRAAARR